MINLLYNIIYHNIISLLFIVYSIIFLNYFFFIFNNWFRFWWSIKLYYSLYVGVTRLLGWRGGLTGRILLLPVSRIFLTRTSSCLCLLCWSLGEWTLSGRELCAWYAWLLPSSEISLRRSTAWFPDGISRYPSWSESSSHSLSIKLRLSVA